MLVIMGDAINCNIKAWYSIILSYKQSESTYFELQLASTFAIRCLLKVYRKLYFNKLTGMLTFTKSLRI